LILEFLFGKTISQNNKKNCKMKTKSYLILVYILSICLLGCSTQNDEDRIKQDLITYFKTIENNNLDENKKLFMNLINPQVCTIQGDFYFIKKNYNKINQKRRLLKQIKVVDSFILSPNIKSKYVIFKIKADKELVRPQQIEFCFPVPYKENSMTLNLKNQFEWKRNIPAYKTFKY